MPLRDLDKEARITINGHTLDSRQVMTLRVAIGNMLMEFEDPDALGENEHGRAMTEFYRKQASYIEHLIFKER